MDPCQMIPGLARHGIILNTENYLECVSFYGDLLGLPALFERNENGAELTCFEYGNGYLMIEEGGKAKKGGKSVAESSFKLRFNVRDIEAALAELLTSGIEASISENAWGRTININDPDGNRIGIRDEAGFASQITQR